MASFVDTAKIHVKAGHGGAGCLSFRREKFIEFGGPNGGDGGHGGHVVLRAKAGLNTLLDFKFQKHFKAKSGRPGEGNLRTGADGFHKYIDVPVGTVIWDETKKYILAELLEANEELIIAAGGIGGRGNASFKSSTNQAPRHTQPGMPGEEKTIILELKLLADIGLVGFPNAGKSTFLSAITNAKPKIAPYPFSTLYPKLGFCFHPHQANKGLIIADIPGLIEGAHTGKGLGDQFLRHIERCQILLFMIDIGDDDPFESFVKLRAELSLYGHDLSSKPFMVALNKIDLCADDTELLDDIKAEFMQKCAAHDAYKNIDCVMISAAGHIGLDAVQKSLFNVATIKDQTSEQ